MLDRTKKRLVQSRMIFTLDDFEPACVEGFGQVLNGQADKLDAADDLYGVAVARGWTIDPGEDVIQQILARSWEAAEAKHWREEEAALDATIRQKLAGRIGQAIADYLSAAGAPAAPVDISVRVRPGRPERPVPRRRVDLAKWIIFNILHRSGLPDPEMLPNQVLVRTVNAQLTGRQLLPLSASTILRAAGRKAGPI
jgi:hypothetical protein